MAALREADYAHETYRHLRMMLVALAGLLLVGTTVAWIFFGQVATSISANYAGPLRNVFVGAMVGIGACLVAIRGRPLEDYALNLAGFYAMFVAFVPSSLSADLKAIDDPELRAAALNSVRVAAVTVVIVTLVFLYAEKKTGHWAGETLSRITTTSRPRRFYTLSQTLSYAFLALLAFGLVVGDYLYLVHPVAAVFMIVSMAVAVACNGWPRAAGEDDLEPVKAYQTIALAMVPGVFGVLLLSWLIPFTRPYTIAIIEWWSVGLFAAFWALETRRTWNPTPLPDGEERPAEVMQADAEPDSTPTV